MSRSSLFRPTAVVWAVLAAFAAGLVLGQSPRAESAPPAAPVSSVVLLHGPDGIASEIEMLPACNTIRLDDGTLRVFVRVPPR